MKFLRSGLFLILVAVASVTSLSANTLVIDPNLGPAHAGPQRGMKMVQVEAAFGTPQSRSQAVGHPPITTWSYAEFTVYFEYDTVLHAVARKR